MGFEKIAGKLKEKLKIGILNKISSSESPQEKLIIHVKGVKNLNNVLSSHFLIPLRDAIENVTVPKDEQLSTTKTKWASLQPELLKKINFLINQSQVSDELNKDLNSLFESASTVKQYKASDFDKYIEQRNTAFKEAKASGVNDEKIFQIKEQIRKVANEIKAIEGDMKRVEKDAEGEIEKSIKDIKQLYEYAIQREINTLNREINKFNELLQKKAPEKIDFEKVESYDELVNLINSWNAKTMNYVPIPNRLLAKTAVKSKQQVKKSSPETVKDIGFSSLTILNYLKEIYYDPENIQSTLSEMEKDKTKMNTKLTAFLRSCVLMSFKKLQFQPQNISTPDDVVQGEIDAVNKLFSNLKILIIEHNSLISASKEKLTKLLEEKKKKIIGMTAIAEISKATVEEIKTLGLQPTLRHYVIVYQKLNRDKQCSDENFRESLDELTKIEPKLTNLKDALAIKEGKSGTFEKYKKRIQEKEEKIQNFNKDLEACGRSTKTLQTNQKLLPIGFIQKDTDTLKKLKEKEHNQVKNSKDSTNHEIQTLLANYSIVMEKKQWILDTSVNTLKSLQTKLKPILENDVAKYEKDLSPKKATQYKSVEKNKTCSGEIFKDPMPLYLFIKKLAFCIDALLSDEQKNYCKIRECYDLGICQYKSNLDKWLRKLSEDVKKIGSIGIPPSSGEKTKPLDFVGSLKYKLVVKK